MRNYFTYICICLFAIFSFFYMNNVIILSSHNNKLIDVINEYKEKNDYKCTEGYINEYGIVLGINGKIVDVNKSYSNMKGIGFKENLVEYKTDYCITNIDNNTDKYILSANPSKNKISIIINVDSGNYYKEMENIFKKYNSYVSLLINKSFLEDNKDILKEKDNLMFKGSSEDELKYFKDNVNDFYCVKTDEVDVVDMCVENNINSIYMKDQIKNNLLYNIKHSLSKGDIVFIKENKFNLNELSASIKYIKSKNLDIVSIDELVF